MTSPPRTIGIPNALLLAQYIPFWKTFFESLGLKVVLSGKTTQGLLRRAVEIAPSHYCLSMKVFIAHSESLLDKVDALFIPSLVSLNLKGHNCPNVLGAPKIIYSVLSPKIPIISPWIDLREKSLYRIAFELAQPYTLNPFTILDAVSNAQKAMALYQTEMTAPLQEIEKRWAEDDDKNSNQIVVGLVGHPYILKDTAINMNCRERLEKCGVKVIESTALGSVDKGEWTGPVKLFSYFGTSRFQWDFSDEVLDSAFTFASKSWCDGVVYLTAFSCGPDALITQFIAEELKARTDKPIAIYNLDEHGGEAGFQTRIESF
ncbi:MAG: acyl-CoA dehydratase activase-related protein, partial [Thermoplasmata archaeon]